jgi:SPP1 family predicted phage head-tail adaptor
VLSETAKKQGRITFNKYNYGQDAQGGNIKALSSSFTVWAEVTQRSYDRSLNNGQVTNPNTFRFRKRHETTRIISPDDEIVYEGGALVIESIENDTEGRKRFDIIIATKTASTTSTTQDITQTVASTVHYVSPGNEYSVPTGQLNWNIPLVFRDSLQYTVILSGVPVGKQVLYTESTGVFLFSTTGPALQAGEVVDIYFLN